MRSFKRNKASRNHLMKLTHSIHTLELGPAAAEQHRFNNDRSVSLRRLPILFTVERSYVIINKASFLFRSVHSVGSLFLQKQSTHRQTIAALLPKQVII